MMKPYLALLLLIFLSANGFSEEIQNVNCSKVLKSSEKNGPGQEFGEVLIEYADYGVVQSCCRSDRGLAQLSYVYGVFVEQLKGKKVLDIGCGGGSFVKGLRELPLAKRPQTVVGLDIKLASWLQDEEDFVEASVTKMPFPDHYFDQIFSSVSFFIKVTETELLLLGFNESLRVLKPGGFLVIDNVVPFIVEKALQRVNQKIKYHYSKKGLLIIKKQRAKKYD